MPEIYFDESLGRIADESLEIAFFQLFHDNVSNEDKAAFPTILNPYTSARFGSSAISFDGALDSLEKALEWASQFGKLAIWRGGDNKWWAKISPDQRECVSHDRQLNAALLAGVQLLRECSVAILNRSRRDNLM